MQRHSARPWLVPLTATSTAADAILPVLPTQTLLVTLALLHPQRWLRTGLWFAWGSVLVGDLMALAVGQLGTEVVARALAAVGVEAATHPDAETGVLAWVREYGPWALAVLALGPWPVRSAVALCALSGVSWLAIAGALAAGRVMAFPGLAWLVTRRPAWLIRVMPRRARLPEIAGPCAPAQGYPVRSRPPSVR